MDYNKDKKGEFIDFHISDLLERLEKREEMPNLENGLRCYVKESTQEYFVHEEDVYALLTNLGFKLLFAAEKSNNVLNIPYNITLH